MALIGPVPDNKSARTSHKSPLRHHHPIIFSSYWRISTIRHEEDKKYRRILETRVVEVGSLSAWAKRAIKISSIAYLLFSRKRVVFARNGKFANFTPYNMQYMPCKSALLVQETLFLPQKALFWSTKFQRVRILQQINIATK